MYSQLPAGIISRSTEIFTVPVNGVRTPACSHNKQTYYFDEMPNHIKALVYKKMKTMPEVEFEMEKLAGNDEESKLKQFMMCRYGAFNTSPDIDDDGVLSESEFVPCDKRGVCQSEGKGCCSIKVGNGEYLSPSELRVFRLYHLSNEEIAEQLFLSVLTVKRHNQNIQAKLGLKNKLQLAIYATKLGIS